MELEGKNVIVTGGAKGIGKCLVEKLLDEGANVGVFDFDENAINDLKASNPNIYCNICDVSNNDQVVDAVNEFYDRFGEIHVLVNNAGIIYNSLLLSFEKGGLKKHDVDMWGKVISTNLSSVFYLTVNVVEKMMLKRTKGVVVNVSSISAHGNLGQSAYSAAKAGVRALTMTWAKELGLLGIRVAGIAPGYTATNTTIDSTNENVLNTYVDRTPLGRMGESSEIADGILFIIQNDFFNGKILELDGGLTI